MAQCFQAKSFRSWNPLISQHVFLISEKMLALRLLQYCVIIIWSVVVWWNVERMLFFIYFGRLPLLYCLYSEFRVASVFPVFQGSAKECIDGKDDVGNRRRVLSRLYSEYDEDEFDYFSSKLV